MRTGCALGIDDELDRAGRTVPDRLAEPHCRGAELQAQRRVQPGRRRLLNDLLIAPLGRAIALAQCDDLTAAVAKELHLDMTRAHDQFLEEHAGVAEMTAGEAAHAVERSA